jgi:hypothetical protein
LAETRHYSFALTVDEVFKRLIDEEYTREIFTAVLNRENITISMDGRGRAFDNIFVEHSGVASSMRMCISMAMQK